MTLKPKMSRLNDPGVDRPDRHLMDLFSPDLKKRIFSGNRRLHVRPKVRNVSIILMIANRFQPGMSVGADGKLFRHFSFKPMRLGKLGRERSKRRPPRR